MCFQCATKSGALPLTTLTVIREHSEMTDWIHSIHYAAPFYISNNNYTKIVVDQVQAVDQQIYNVLYLSTGMLWLIKRCLQCFALLFVPCVFSLLIWLEVMHCLWCFKQLCVCHCCLRFWKDPQSVRGRDKALYHFWDLALHSFNHTVNETWLQKGNARLKCCFETACHAMVANISTSVQYTLLNVSHDLTF